MSSKHWLRTAIVYGTLTITIPDAKDAKVVEARNAYNAKNGTSLSTTQYVKEILRIGVINDLVQAKQRDAQATVSAKEAECRTVIGGANASSDTFIATEGAGW